MFDEVDRDIAVLRLGRWGRVDAVDGLIPWLVVADDGSAVEPIRRYLIDFVARANSPKSVRSYAFVLLRWWRWLRAVGVEWNQATPCEGRDFVLWLMQAHKPRNSQRTKSITTAGTVNPITRKRYLNDRYAARTIRHSNAVVRAFYEYWIEQGAGPLVNPIPVDRGRRANAHHNPMEPFRPEGRIRYNPRLPKQLPREIPDDHWHDLFGALRSNRDRALLALTISTAARAEEILGIGLANLDWGDQKVQGHGEQWRGIRR